MAGLCEGGNEPQGSLKASKVVNLESLNNLEELVELEKVVPRRKASPLWPHAFSAWRTPPGALQDDNNALIESAMRISYKICHEIAKELKTFNEGNFIKRCLIILADELCPQQVGEVEAICLSRRTVVRRLEYVPVAMESSLVNDAVICLLVLHYDAMKSIKRLKRVTGLGHEMSDLVTTIAYRPLRGRPATDIVVGLRAKRTSTPRVQ
ncbi:hypothetical protein ANN_16815 [Periplaneta americana]|uniref:Uncharacterized protein n=1 Tax=Periplaneta americana TaxID=6978 RepID=A0ABQ8SSA3_PERAM|nr:hypothetical protein ANN_16815 [Periplaneta americana]